MFDLKTPLFAALVLVGLALPPGAQETDPAADPAAAATETVPAAEVGPLSLGEEVGGIGSAYTAETFDSWEMRCVRTEDGNDPCELYQLLKDGDGNSVAEISIFGLRDPGEAVAGATIITPLETLLTSAVTMGVDTAKPKRYPFTFCAVNGCVARVGFTAAEVDGFRKGASGKIVIVPAVAPNETVVLAVSLKGFTAGFDAVNAANAKLKQPEPVPAPEPAPAP